MGVVLNSFTRKRLLGRPWANLVRNYLARPQSRVSFWLRMFSCLIFRARFRALFRVASYSYSVYTNVCLLVLASSYQKIYLLLFTNYIHIVYPCACLCFWQGGMDYGINFGPEACAFLARKLARIWAEHFSLRGFGLNISLFGRICIVYVLLIYIFVCLWGGVSTAPAWDCPCGKQKRMQNYHTSIQKHVEETTFTQFPLRKTWGRPCTKLARCRF